MLGVCLCNIIQVVYNPTLHHPVDVKHHVYFYPVKVYRKTLSPFQVGKSFWYITSKTKSQISTLRRTHTRLTIARYFTPAAARIQLQGWVRGGWGDGWRWSGGGWGWGCPAWGWWWWGGGGGNRRVLKRPAHSQVNHGSSFILLFTASFVQAESATTRWNESVEKADLRLVRPDTLTTLHAVASLVIPAKPTLSKARFPSVFRHPSSRNLTEVRMSWTSAWEFGQQWPSAPYTQK